MYVLIILFTAYPAQMIFTTDKKSSFLSLKYFLAALAMVVVYWTLFAGNLIHTLLFSVRNLEPGYATNTMTSMISTPASELFNYLQYTPFLFFILIGVIFVLKSDKIGNVAKILCITALALVPPTFPGPAIMLDKLLVEVGPDRLFENGFLFMALAAGAGRLS
jgi:hypothetical protein